MDINVKLNNYEDLVNKFNEEELNEELGDYVYKRAVISKISKDKFFRINIKTEFEVGQKEQIIDMIRAYFGNRTKEEIIFLEHTYLKNILLFVSGILLLATAYFLETVTNFLLPEIFIIVGWLAIGEVAYAIIFSNSKRRLRIKLLKKLTKCKIKINEE